MKKILKIVVIVLAAIFCLLAVLSLFSGPLINNHALPEAEKLLGVDVALDSASLNLLSGSFTAKGLTVANPKGYEEPHFITADMASLRLSILQLLGGKIVIKSAELREFTLHVVRNADGDFNAAHFAERLKTESPEASEADDADAAAVPGLTVARLKAGIKLRYVDHAFTSNTLDYAFLTAISMEDISNYGPAEDYGTISIDSTFLNNPKTMTAALSARVAPLSDPLRPTFEANGHIKSEDVKGLEGLAREIGLSAKSFTVDTPIKCSDGNLRGDLKLSLNDPTPLGSLEKKLRKVKLPASLTVTVPVRGTVDRPRIDWTGAILQSLLNTALDGLDTALQDLVSDQDSLKENVDGLVDSLKGLFKKKEKE